MRAHDSTPSSLRAGVAALVLALAALSPATGAEDQAGWLWWRGPLGNGVSPDGDPPLRWSERENVRFKVPIDGDGLATPIVWGDRIYVLSALSLDEADEGARPATEPSEGTPLPRLRFLVTAYDRHDGSVEWQRVADERVPHEGHHLESAWANASPVTDGERVYAHFGSAGTYAYTLEGELLWSVSGLGMNVIPTPTYDEGTLYLASGKRDSPRMQAVDLRGAKGDLDGTDAVLWTRDRDTPYVSTPLLYRGQLYFFKHVRSFLTSVDAATGQTLFTERVGLGNVFASPVAAAGRIYLFGREGKALVLEPSPTLKILAENQLDDGFDASPVIVGGDLYLRGRRFLYAVARADDD